MTSIVIEDRAGGGKYIYRPRYPEQRGLFEETKCERILNSFKEIKNIGNINIYLYKKGKLREIAVRPV